MKTILRSFGMFVGVLLFSTPAALAQANRPAPGPTKKAALHTGETARLKAFLVKYDLSRLWTTTESSEIFGFIGAGYQRLQIHFLSVAKDPNDPAIYLVEGKTLVRNRVRRFTGKIVVEAETVYPPTAVDEYYSEHGLTAGAISGRYLFRQNPKQRGTGVFEGKLTTYYYTDKQGAIHYDDLDEAADGYSNNPFVGTWKSYRGTQVKKCNWGDYRVPDSGDLDIGAGEFYPNDKYVKNGWKSYLAEQQMTAREGGKPKENKWWK